MRRMFITFIILAAFGHSAYAAGGTKGAIREPADTVGYATTPLADEDCRGNLGFAYRDRGASFRPPISFFGSGGDDRCDRSPR